MGEQVAQKAGYAWIDGVRADLKAENYACERVDIPACSAGAPHIRNRLYWVADPEANRREHEPSIPRSNATGVEQRRKGPKSSPHRSYGRVAEPDNAERWAEEPGGNQHNGDQAGRQQGYGDIEVRRTDGGLGEPLFERLQGHSGDVSDWRESGWIGPRPNGFAAAPGLHDFWSDWVLIGPDPEGKYRRIKPGIAPVASRVPGRIHKLRAWGNAIVPPLAAEVIRAYMEARGLVELPEELAA